MSALGRNGRQDQEQLMDKQSRDGMHQAAQSSMLADDGEVSTDYLREITQHGLPDGTYDHMASLLSPDLVLSNLEKAEVNEYKWLIRYTVKKMKAAHPDEDSYVQGEYRKFLRDNPKDGRKPLSQRQKQLIEHAAWVVISRIARSESGWQQEEIGKTTNVSEVQDSRSQSRGWNPFS